MTITDQQIEAWFGTAPDPPLPGDQQMRFALILGGAYEMAFKIRDNAPASCAEAIGDLRDLMALVRCKFEQEEAHAK